MSGGGAITGGGLLDAVRASYNAIVVVAGTTVLGAAGGLVGSFAVLRKRALLVDTLAHATLPGIAGAFLVVVALGGTGKSMVTLLPGAAAGGVAALLAVAGLTRWTRLREDAALAVVLSAAFGLGVVALSHVQRLPVGTQAGLKSYVYGQTAAMSVEDVATIAVAGLVALCVTVAISKELALVAFDADHAAVLGVPVHRLDLALMTLIVVVTVVALQAVGLVLAVAVLIIPAASARLWTDRLRIMVPLATAIGAGGACAGALASATWPRMPAGSVIVLTQGALFTLSLVAAPRRGVIAGVWRLARLRATMARDHLLRAIWEVRERTGTAAVDVGAIAAHRGMSVGGAARALGVLAAAGLVRRAGDEVVMTERGETIARRVTRNHRLWEQYLITYADVAPSHVDVSADRVEHALGPELVGLLEERLRERGVLPERLPDHRDREPSA